MRINLTEEELIPLAAGGQSSLTLVTEVEPRADGRRVICVRCVCGNTFTVLLTSVRTGRTTMCKSCALKKKRSARGVKKFIGKKFGCLTVIRPTPKHLRNDRHFQWECQCSCGNKVHVRTDALSSGATKSCGCLAKARSKARGANWAPGTEINGFVILKQVESRSNEAQRYKVLDTRDQQIKVLFSARIRSYGDPLKTFKKRCIARIWHARKRMGIEKTASFTAFFGYSEEDLLQQLGPQPTKGCHIDHICPLSRARNETKLLKLFDLRNLQWLSPTKNLIKGTRWTPRGEKNHKLLLGRPWKSN